MGRPTAAGSAAWLLVYALFLHGAASRRDRAAEANMVLHSADGAAMSEASQGIDPRRWGLGLWSFFLAQRSIEALHAGEPDPAVSLSGAAKFPNDASASGDKKHTKKIGHPLIDTPDKAPQSLPDRHQVFASAMPADVAAAVVDLDWADSWQNALEKANAPVVRPGPSKWPKALKRAVADIQLISESSTSTVYRAVLTSTVSGCPAGTAVVLKEFTESPANEGKVRRKLSAAKVLNGGDFPVTLWCSSINDSGPGIIMMEAAAGTANDLIVNKTFEEVSWTTRLRLVKQFLQGVTNMHSRGFVHRNLRPDNLLIFGDCRSGDCNLRIGDLGLAIHVEAMNPYDWYTRRSRTIAGSPRYMPPELLNPDFNSHTIRTYDEQKQDAFAAGLVLSEILFGVHPSVHLDWHKVEIDEKVAPRKTVLQLKQLVQALLNSSLSDRLSVADASAALDKLLGQ